MEMSIKVVISENDREMVIASRGLKKMGGELIGGEREIESHFAGQPKV